MLDLPGVASVLMRDRIGLWVRFLAVSRWLLCSAVLFVVDVYCQFASLSSSSQVFLNWPKQQRHDEDHYSQSEYEQYQSVL